MVITIAIDGYGGSGESTFADLLAIKLGAKVIHTDDFATKENPLNWWPEVIEKVLKPFKNDNKTSGLLVLEGVSSLRKEFRQYIDFGIFINTPIDICMQRGLVREKESTSLPEEEIFKNWLHWFEDENNYMNRDNPESFAKLVVDGTKDFQKQIDALNIGTLLQ